MEIEVPNDMREKVMDIMEHLAELRTRVLKAMGWFVLATAVSVLYLAPYAIDFLARPAGGTTVLHAIEVTETFGVHMRVALLMGFIMAIPVIVYQLLAFIFPGLYSNERRWVLIAVPTATLLFIGGAAFAYFVLLYTALPFLATFMEDIENNWRLSNYIEFVTNLLFWIGLAFETPLAVFMLAKFNVLSAGLLLKQWRFAIVIIAVIAAVVTPTPDPITMALTMGPLFAIYLLSVGFAAIAQIGKEV